MPGVGDAEVARSRTVVREGRESAVLDQRGRGGRDALAVEQRVAKAVRAPRHVPDVETVDADLLADPLAQRTDAVARGLAGEHRGERTEQGGLALHVEHHVVVATGDGLAVEQRKASCVGLFDDGGRVEVVELACRALHAVEHVLVAVLEQGVCVGAAQPGLAVGGVPGRCENVPLGSHVLHAVVGDVLNLLTGCEFALQGERRVDLGLHGRGILPAQDGVIGIECTVAVGDGFKAVLSGERRVLQRLRDHRVESRRIRRFAVGDPGPSILDDPHAVNACRVDLVFLEVAVVGLQGQRCFLMDDQVAGGPCGRDPLEDAVGMIVNPFHQALPPTRMSSTLRVAWPTVVGTMPETEPQMPVARAKSAPTMEMRRRTSGPVLMSVAAFTG